MVNVLIIMAVSFSILEVIILFMLLSSILEIGEDGRPLSSKSIAIGQNASYIALSLPVVIVILYACIVYQSEESIVENAFSSSIQGQKYEINTDSDIILIGRKKGNKLEIETIKYKIVFDDAFIVSSKKELINIPSGPKKSWIGEVENENKRIHEDSNSRRQSSCKIKE